MHARRYLEQLEIHVVRHHRPLGILLFWEPNARQRVMARPQSKKQTFREALLASLRNPDRRRLHALANGVRTRLGQMSRADAYAVLADEQGIKLHGYLFEPDLGRVRGIIAAGRAAAPVSGNGRRPRAKTATRLKEIVIDGASLVMDDPILPAQVAADR